MKRICHITTVHSRYDVRIFHKECSSLSEHYDTSLIVSDGKGDEIKNGIKIFDTGLRQSKRIKRAKTDSAKALKKALELDCDLYHFHDPELIKIGEQLKKAGKIVIYDAHEDLPRQIYSKPYLPRFSMGTISKLIEWQENKAAAKFDYIITATSFIRDRFLKINPNTTDINNYPVLGELHNKTVSKIPDRFCYTGGITRERGLREIVSAFENSKAKLTLAGPVDNNEFLNELKSLNGWKNVDFKGLVDRLKLSEILSSSIAGLVLFLPHPNHINAQPNKIFEYMSSEIAVIGSDFPLWKEIIEENNCGVCINPADVNKINETLDFFINNIDKVKEMGKNGFKAVHEKYNWNLEKAKLLKIYNKLL